MGGFGEDGYTARTQAELMQSYINSVEARYDGTLEPYEGSFNRALFAGFATAVHENQEQDLEALYDSMFVESATGDELTMLAKQYGIRRQPAVAATGVVEWTRPTTQADSERVVQKGTPVETRGSDPVRYITTTAAVLDGPQSVEDATTYTTSSTSWTTVSSATVDTAFRDSISVEADYRTQTASYTAYVEIRDATNGVLIASNSTTSTTTQTLSDTYDTTGLDEDVTIEYRIRIGNASGTAELSRSLVDAPGQHGARSNIKATEAGTIGNVGADRVTVMPSPPPGVNGVTNPWPVGSPEYSLVGGRQQTLGQDREPDSSLRERVLDGSSIGGAATVRAVRDKIRSLDGTPSLTIFTNRQTTDNANGNGLPKLSAELVIRSPSVPDQAVADAIHDVVSIGERLTAGHNGTKITRDVDSTTLAQTRTIEWSEPAEVALSVTLDVVEADGYAGDEPVKEAVAAYIGGTLPDGSPVGGLDVSSDVIVDELERRVNSLQGVLGVASVSIDATGDGVDDTTTRSDGLTALEIAAYEVAVVDGVNDITIT